jgi:hypothetical protein
LYIKPNNLSLLQLQYPEIIPNTHTQNPKYNNTQITQPLDSKTTAKPHVKFDPPAHYETNKPNNCSPRQPNNLDQYQTSPDIKSIHNLPCQSISCTEQINRKQAATKVEEKLI